MTEHIEIRKTRPDDASAIEELYADAFPDEDLLPLVSALHEEEIGVISLVVMIDQDLAGHVIFTLCGIEGTSEKTALLGPLAVSSGQQGQGVGSTIVRAGFHNMEKAAVTRVFVLGDPAYYSRFGFRREDGVAPPYPLPKEWVGAWQSLSLNGGKPDIRGRLSVPGPWRREALWSP